MHLDINFHKVRLFFFELPTVEAHIYYLSIFRQVGGVPPGIEVAEIVSKGLQCVSCHIRVVPKHLNITKIT